MLYKPNISSFVIAPVIADTTLSNVELIPNSTMFLYSKCNSQLQESLTGIDISFANSSSSEKSYKLYY